MQIPSLRPPAGVNFQYIIVCFYRGSFTSCFFPVAFAMRFLPLFVWPSASFRAKWCIVSGFLSTDGRERIKRQGHQISDLISSGQTRAMAGRNQAEICSQRSGDLDLNQNWLLIFVLFPYHILRSDFKIRLTNINGLKTTQLQNMNIQNCNCQAFLR